MALDLIDTSSNSSVSPFFQNDNYILPSGEKYDLKTDLQSSPLTDFDHSSMWDEVSALHSNRLMLDVGTTYPNAAPWTSSENSTNKETTTRGGGDADITLEECLNNQLPWKLAQFSNMAGNSKPHTTLSRAEIARLRTVAMPVQSHAASPTASSPSSESEGTRRRRNRTLSETPESDCLAPRSKRIINKRRAHNVIEKRYRTNLVDKLSELRDSIPGLRFETDNSPDEDSQSLSAAPKLNKATILSKATEYIGQLARQNQDLSKENRALQIRISAFEMLLTAQRGFDST